MTEIVERFFKALCREAAKYEDNSVDFYEMVLDCTSFGRTVENIFYLSFLIRDGHVTLCLDDSSLPVLKPERASKVSAAAASPSAKSLNSSRGCQFLATMNMQEWTELCAEWKITQPLFKR